MHPTCYDADEYSSSNASYTAHCAVVKVGQRIPGVSDCRSVEDKQHMSLVLWVLKLGFTVT